MWTRASGMRQVPLTANVTLIWKVSLLWKVISGMPLKRLRRRTGPVHPTLQVVSRTSRNCSHCHVGSQFSSPSIDTRAMRTSISDVQVLVTAS